MTRVVAVANQKGGVGKTTTTVNVAAALGRSGHRTLVIDLDPQGNATQALGLLRNFDELSVYDALIDGVPMAQVAKSTNEPSVWCAPASVDLAGAEVELVAMERRESRLAESLTAVSESGDQSTSPSFDFVLVDCPPSLGLLTVNALAAAQELFVPIQAEFYALDGVGQLVRTMELVRSALNPQLEVSLVAVTMVGTDIPSQEHVLDEIRAFFGPRLARTVIPRDPVLSAAPSVGQTVLSFDADSAGARAYLELAQELVKVPAKS